MPNYESSDATSSSQCEDDDHKILVAVDFGTTFSALAWAQTRRPDVTEVVKTWPHLLQGSQSCDKVPTEIRYDEEINFAITWGTEILPEFHRHQLFKLELDESRKYKTTDVSRNHQDPKALPPGYDSRPEKMICDYLTCLRQHAEKLIRNAIPAPVLDSTPTEYIVTVPAVWTESAKVKMKAASQLAGMGRVHLVAEPEAGAVFAMHVLHPHAIKVGDNFLLVDAGGGTVDVITYKIDELKPILKISEVSPGAGALCGSSYISRLFIESMTNKLSCDRNWQDDVLDEAKDRFENVIKKNFAGVGGEQWQLPVPGLHDSVALGISRGRLRLTGDEVKEFFEPVVNETVALVCDQISAIKDLDTSRTTIILIGGLGQNPYLRSEIQRSAGSIPVMQSPQGWTAVVQGALMMGLASTSSTHDGVRIAARKARKHYGYLKSVPFDPRMHERARKYWSPRFSAYRVVVVHWFLRKNDTVREQNPLRLCMWKETDTSQGQGPPRVVDIEIVCCADPFNEGPPRHADARVNELVTVHADIGRVPEELITKKWGKDGSLSYHFELQLEITHLSAFTTYELIYKGVNYGPVHAEYV